MTEDKKIELIVQIASGILASDSGIADPEILADLAAGYLSALIQEVENTHIPRL